MNTLTSQRGTLYLGNGFAYRRMEAREIEIQIGRRAQFAQAIMVTYTRKGARKRLRMELTSGKLVVLDGWKHPPPPGDYSAGRPLSPIPTRFGMVTATVHTTRYPLGDDRWDTEFNAFFADYLPRSGARVVADYRDHDFKDDYGPHLHWKDLTPDMPVIVFGVENGEVIPPEQWKVGEFGRCPPRQEFDNLAEARKVFPELDLKRSSKRFHGPVVDKKKDGRFRARFDTWDLYHILSQD